MTPVSLILVICLIRQVERYGSEKGVNAEQLFREPLRFAADMIRGKCLLFIFDV